MAWKREDWNDIIQRINDLVQNPDSGCDTLTPLDEVDPNHIWTKQDVIDVRDKLQEICNENTFNEVLRLWSQVVIDEINEAIDNGWCGCSDREVIEWNFTTHGCTTTTPSCAAQNDAADLGNQAEAAAYIYKAKWRLYCTDLWYIDCLNEKIESLTQQLTTLEAYRDQVCEEGPPSACEAAQDDVDAKQDELDAANEALDQAEEDRDQHEEEATEQRNICNAKAAACWAIINNLPGISLVSDIGVHPWVNFKCRGGWTVAQLRIVTHFPWGDSETLTPTTIAGGGYSPDGTPYTRAHLIHGFECLSRSPYTCSGDCEHMVCNVDYPYCCDNTYYMRTGQTKPNCSQECEDDPIPCPP